MLMKHLRFASQLSPATLFRAVLHMLSGPLACLVGIKAIVITPCDLVVIVTNNKLILRVSGLLAGNPRALAEEPCGVDTGALRR